MTGWLCAACGHNEHEPATLHNLPFVRCTRCGHYFDPPQERNTMENQPFRETHDERARAAVVGKAGAALADALTDPANAVGRPAIARYQDALGRGLSHAEAQEEGWPTTPEPRPFSFTTPEHHESANEYRDRIVREALGAASVCWDPMNGTGVFQDARANEIADTLIAALERRFEPR